MDKKIEPVVAKPVGKAPGTRRIISKNEVKIVKLSRKELNKKLRGWLPWL